MTAVQQDPNFADAYLNLGNAFMEMGKFAEAADAFESCVRVEPDNIACKNNLPIANRQKALVDPKLRNEREGLLQQPTAARYYQMGQMEHERGLRSEEERDYKRCVQLDGHYIPCHYGLYLIFKEDQKSRDAKAACTNVLRFGTAEDFPAEVDDCRKFLGGTPL
jgi:tetratricopeptide (TPR) repeat protein